MIGCKACEERRKRWANALRVAAERAAAVFARGQVPAGAGDRGFREDQDRHGADRIGPGRQGGGD